jgi:hypothetical protein
VTRVLILTHGDPDGMTSAIMLLQKHGVDSEVRFSNAKKLAQSLQDVAVMEPRPEDVFIADLPLMRGREGAVETAARRLHACGCRLHLYDHHSGWDAPTMRARLAPLFRTYVVDSRKTTAAALVWRDGLGGAPGAERWLQLLSEKDQSADDGIRHDYYLLVALMQPCNWRLSRTTLTSLARGGPPGDEQRQLVDWYERVHLPKERALAEGAEVLQARSGLRIGWADLRRERGHFNVSKLVVKYHHVDLVATVTRGGVIFGSDSIDKGPDLSALHGEHEWGGIRVSVAGHRSPVRIPPCARPVDDTFVTAVRAALLESL